MTDWKTFTKRTNDPKLAWIERALTARGIPSRRHGFSWHAPILEVPAEYLATAQDFLAQPFDGDGNQTVDDVADDDPTFDEL